MQVLLCLWMKYIYFFALQVLVIQQLLLHDLESAIDLESHDSAPTTAIRLPSQLLGSDVRHLHALPKLNCTG